MKPKEVLQTGRKRKKRCASRYKWKSNPGSPEWQPSVQTTIVSIIHRTLSREGVILKYPLKDLFHDVVTVILTSQMGVSEIVVIVGNVVTVIYGIIHSR